LSTPATVEWSNQETAQADERAFQNTKDFQPPACSDKTVSGPFLKSFVVSSTTVYYRQLSDGWISGLPSRFVFLSSS